MTDRTHWGPMESLEDAATEADTPDADDVVFVGPVRYDRNTRDIQERAHMQAQHRAALIQRGFDADLLDAQHGQYYTTQLAGADIGHPNLNDDTPAAPAGYVNVTWQVDADGNISAYSQDYSEPTATADTNGASAANFNVAKTDGRAYDIEAHLVAIVIASPELGGDPQIGASAVYKANVHYDPDTDTMITVSEDLSDPGLNPIVDSAATAFSESAGIFGLSVQGVGGWSGTVTIRWLLYYTLRQSGSPT